MSPEVRYALLIVLGALVCLAIGPIAGPVAALVWAAFWCGLGELTGLLDAADRKATKLLEEAEALRYSAPSSSKRDRVSWLLECSRWEGEYLVCGDYAAKDPSDFGDLFRSVLEDRCIGYVWRWDEIQDQRKQECRRLVASQIQVQCLSFQEAEARVQALLKATQEGAEGYLAEGAKSGSRTRTSEELWAEEWRRKRLGLPYKKRWVDIA